MFDDEKMKDSEKESSPAVEAEKGAVMTGKNPDSLETVVGDVNSTM